MRPGLLEQVQQVERRLRVLERPHAELCLEEADERRCEMCAGMRTLLQKLDAHCLCPLPYLRGSAGTCEAVGGWVGGELNRWPLRDGLWSEQ